MDQLVLLDVSGILGCKVEGECTGELVQARHYQFLLRPGIRAFLEELRTEYTVGIFSSTTYTNIINILKAIGGEFTPLMDRALTTFDPEQEEHETIKLLSTFWHNPVHNRERRWSASNTLLVDDSPAKVRFNDARNVLIVESFTPASEEESTLLRLKEAIKAKITAL